jgi:ferritin-like metal-binding protein YciE
MKIESLHELYLTELQDLYDAEDRILDALPKMIDKASSEDLKAALMNHLEETRGQVTRLEEVFRLHGEKPEGTKCKGIAGILDEGEDLVKKNSDPFVRDAAIVAAAQRVEHYEIAAYGTVRTYAQQMGHTDAASLLQQTLDEEGAADKKLTQIAEQRVNEAAKRVA